MPKYEVGLVFNGQRDRDWLPLLRKWLSTEGQSLGKLGIEADFVPRPGLKQALAWRAELPQDRIVATFGFGAREVQATEHFDVPGEPIIVRDPRGQACWSATFFPNDKAVVCSDVKSQLRKSLIRAAWRKRISVRLATSEEDLRGYFALRYRIWNADGYLRESNKAARMKWEIDYWDRTAIPVVAVSQEGVIGCTRLIQANGHEEQPYCTNIERLLKTASDPTLDELFAFPHELRQPFDVLHEFPGFREHYSKVVRCRRRTAEIGRVIVDPAQRGKFLSEILVDTAASLADKKGIDCLFLACRNELEQVYGNCGFQRVPGLSTDKFFNIPVPSIVMEKWMSDVPEILTKAG